MTPAIIPAGVESNEIYHASGAWGSTLINAYYKSPALAAAKRRGDGPDTEALRFGKLFHDLLDDSVVFDERYVVGPCNDRRKAGWKAAAGEAREAGLQIVKPQDHDLARRLVDSIDANPYARVVVAGAEHEVGFRMDSPYGAYRVQCRADLLHCWELIVDVKTVADVDSFERSIVDHGYHRQAAFYSWLIGLACGKSLPFCFVAVEKSAAGRCRVIDLDEEWLEIGWRQVEQTLRDIGRSIAKDDWDDPKQRVQLPVPDWYRRRCQVRGEASHAA